MSGSEVMGVQHEQQGSGNTSQGSSGAVKEE